ncbi:MAG: EamA family transporter [Acidobacteriia bacterium]|nr:EamA family transporter [Terriglobia bacterium]
MICVTLISAAAQVLIKTGAGSLGPHPSLAQTAIGILTKLPLFVGYSMYGFSMVLLVLALRHGELSALYPVIALTFVWVTILSVVVFHEHMNATKMAGVALIVIGVATLGRGGKK